MVRARRNGIVILFLVSLVPVIRLWAQSGVDNIATKNDTTKRSTIVEVDGYAYISEDKTPRQMREEALANAKREALERAQTYIKSVTKVENFMLEYDLIQTGAEGFVRVLESKDHGITSDNRYHYWIKAEVEYSLESARDRKDLSVDLIKNENAPLTVYIWTEKKEYKAGEKIRVFLQGNKDFYARVVYRDVSGNLLQLLPNQHRKENFFKGGKVVTIPGEGDRFDLEVGPPFGIENIIVYASSTRMGDVDVEEMGNALYGIQGDLEKYGAKTRGVKITERKVGERSQSAEFIEARWELLTKMQE